MLVIRSGRDKIIIILSTLLLIGALLIWNYPFLQLLVADTKTNDFDKFYYAAESFLAGRDMYDINPATKLIFPEDTWRYHTNHNPPHFHLLILPLTVFPVQQALYIWGFLNALCLFASIRLAVRELQYLVHLENGLVAVAAILSFSATSVLLMTAQISWLLLLPLTFAWVMARRGEWGLTGIALGLVTGIKPFILLFLPYLLLERQYRAVLFYLLMISASFLSGIAVFGTSSYSEWVRLLSSVDYFWPPTNSSLYGFLSRLFSRTELYTPILDEPWLVRPLWIVGASAIGVLALLVCKLDSSSQRIDRSFLLLLVSGQLISPLGWVYYWWLYVVPLLSLVAQRPAAADPLIRGGDRRYRLLSMMLIGIMMTGLLSPVAAICIVFGTHTLPYTLLWGSVCFWANLALYLFLIRDFFTWRKPPVTGSR